MCNLFINSGNSSNQCSLVDVLKEHIASYINVADDPSQRQKISVRRQAIWKGTFRCLKMPFNFSRGLDVSFVGEGAVDDGGPLREYLRLLLYELGNNCSLFCGPDNCRTAMHNMSALHKEEYLHVGQCIALSILYNGPGPHFFSDAAANYLLGIPVIDISHKDIPDPEIIDKVTQVNMLQVHVLKIINGVHFCEQRLRTVNQLRL